MVLPFSSVTHTFSLSSFRACSDIARAAVAHASLSPFRACSCSGSLSVGHRRCRSSGLAPLSHTSIHLYIPLHPLFSYFLTSRTPALLPFCESASRHSYLAKLLFSTDSFKHPLPVTRSTAGPTPRSPHLPGLLDASTGSIILRSPRPHRSLDQTWMSRLWSCLSRRVSSLLFWSPGEPLRPPATKVSGWRRWLQR